MTGRHVSGTAHRAASDEPDGPLVSVVIPCHQGAAFVDQALASCIGQTYRPLEVVVVDDGSTDDSAERVEAWAGRDAPVRLIRHRRNRGVSVARNHGMEAAEGELVAFLDVDDLWMPQKLERQVARYREVAATGSPLGFCDVLVRMPDGRVTLADFRRRLVPRNLHHRSPDRGLATMLRSNVVPTSGALADRELLLDLGGFRDEFHNAQDYELWLRVAENHPLHYLREPLVLYRRRTDSLSTSGRMHEYEERILRAWERRRPDLQPAIRRGRARIAYERACAALARDDRAAARRQVPTVLRGDPWRRKYWPAVIKALVPAAVVDLLRGIYRG